MKLSRESAYEVLGIKEGASKDEILKRYDILLRKHKTGAAGATDEEEVDIDKITVAYNLLMGIDDGTSIDENFKPNPVFQKMNIDERKVKNYVHYYKYHFLIGLVVLAVMIYTLYGCVTRVTPDMNVAFVGDMYVSDTATVEKEIISLMPECKAVGVDSAIVSDSVDSQQSYAGVQKAMVLFAAGDIDLFFLDKASFEQYGDQGAFMSLDEFAAEMNIDKEKSGDLILQPKEETKKHLYGIDISDTSFAKNSGVAFKELIAAVRINAKNTDKAINLLKSILN